MKTVELVFAIGWALFWIGWIAAAFSMKRAHVASSRSIRIRLVLLVIFILLVHTKVFSHLDTHTDPLRVGVGLALFVLGLAFAIWARVYIGRNWGTPMMKKTGSELVTSGPYHLVRHPIYSGILVAGIGTAISLGWAWLVLVALYGSYFIYSATQEEHYMTTQFPEAYPTYKRASKMLIPFIF